MKFKITSSQKKIIKFAKSKFFVNGRNSKHIRISSFSSFQLGNSSGKPIPSKMIVNGEEVDFTLENYAQTTCLTRYRFYLLMKKLSDVLDSLTHDTDSENEFELPKIKRKFNTNQMGNDSCSSAFEIDPTLPYETTTLFEPTRSFAFVGSSVLATPSILSGHTTIGTSNERACLREENERAYEESVRTDMERERAARESESDSNTSRENVSSNSLGPITYGDAEEEQKCIELMSKRKEKAPNDQI